MLQSSGVVVELPSLLAQQADQPLTAEGRQIADGAYAIFLEHLVGRTADKQEVRDRKGPDLGRYVRPGDDRGGVGFFHVAAQLGKDLVEGDAHRDGEALLPADHRPELVCNIPCVTAEEVHGAGDVQPALVDAEGLYQIGIALINGVDPSGDPAVLLMVGGKENEAGTLFPGLPDGLRRFDLEAFGRFVFCQDNAVPALRISAYGHRLVPEVGPVP